MARTKKNRIIQMAPHFHGFNPIGVQSSKKKEVIIHFEEYEALKLCDYELLTQAEAAEIMHISRPTFTRIYESVRRKIATAFMESCNIRFSGGNVQVLKWYHCESCKITFSLDAGGDRHCPFCQKECITEND